MMEETPLNTVLEIVQINSALYLLDGVSIRASTRPRITTHFNTITGKIFKYVMSKKSCAIFIVFSLYRNRQDIMDIQYIYFICVII